MLLPAKKEKNAAPVSGDCCDFLLPHLWVLSARLFYKRMKTFLLTKKLRLVKTIDSSVFSPRWRRRKRREGEFQRPIFSSDLSHEVGTAIISGSSRLIAHMTKKKRDMACFLFSPRQRQPQVAVKDTTGKKGLSKKEVEKGES